MKIIVFFIVVLVTIGWTWGVSHAVTVWGPMIDNFDTNTDADEWYAIADSNGNVSSTIHSGDDSFTASLFGSSGSDTLFIGSGLDGTVSLSGLTPGETVRLDVFGGFHYRPMFEGFSVKQPNGSN